MTLITSDNAAAASQLPKTQPPPGFQLLNRSAKPRGSAEEVRQRFTQFIGEAFFGQMIQAMRATTGKAAYFHGGRAEEVFQGQLDQRLAEHLTVASADRFAEPMFERQFPKLAAQLKETTPFHSEQLAHLSRR